MNASLTRRDFGKQLLTGIGAAAMCPAAVAAVASPQSSPTNSAVHPRLRLAVIGLQNGHILGFVDEAKKRSDVEIVACCEEDPTVRERLTKGGRIKITHTDYRQMLREVPADVVAVGEWFGKRGRVVIDSLKSGRHVISDKPLCTTLADYEEIVGLARTKKLAIGLMLSLRDSGLFIKMRELVRAGEIGDVHEISLGGQHPLRPGSRPHWYDEPGKHGGTINDIGVHGFDLVPWVTGLNFRRVVAARAWKTSGVPENSSFLNGGQAMFELANSAGVTGSFSYVSPTSMGYKLPMYWRATVWGSGGALEGGLNYPGVILYKEGATAGVTLPNAVSAPHSYFESFLRQVRGMPDDGLTTSEVLRATWVALKTQEAADKALGGVAL